MPISDTVLLNINFGGYTPVCDFCKKNGRCVAPLHKDIERCECTGGILVNNKGESVCELCRKKVEFNIEKKTCANFVPFEYEQISALVKNK